MGKLPRGFRKQKKYLVVWGLLVAAIFLGGLLRWCDRSDSFFCSEQGLLTLPLLSIAILIFLLIRRAKPLVLLPEQAAFRERPWEFDSKTVTIQGRIEHIFSNSMAEKIKRRIRDTYRNFTDNDDPSYRYIHQRFLLSSAMLKRGECLLVEHSINYGKVRLRQGSRIEVRGEYLHTVRKGSRHFYGRIHFTHEPNGHIKAL